MRKRRTRKHIIADLAANHFERHVLRCGFTFEKVQYDYGLDMIMFTYQPNGEIEDGLVNIQLKASDNIKAKYEETNAYFSFPVKQSDLSYWLDQPWPVFLVIYDAKTDKAYWVYIQNYFESMAGFSLKNVKKTYSIRIPTHQIIDENAIRRFAEFKHSVSNQIDGEITHA